LLYWCYGTIMTKTKWFLTGVLVSTFASSLIFAQDADLPAIKVPEKMPDLNIYPIPVKDVATFEFDQMGDKNWVIKQMQIFNILGVEMHTVPGTEFKCSKSLYKPCVLEYKLDFTDQQKGVYLVLIEAINLDTKIKRTRKVIYDE